MTRGETTMHDLAGFLEHLRGQPLDTIVHVHPSDAALVGHYEALGVQRVVLVCPDPEALRGFRRLAPGRPWLQIVESAVTPWAGSADWWVYSVPGVSGLLEAGTLREVFPRLEAQLRIRVEAVALQTLLERLDLRVGEQGNLLVLEAPGTDAPILAGVRPDMLTCFDWLLLRGATTAELYSQGVAADAALRLLSERHFSTVASTEADEPLWPTTLLRLDRSAAQSAALQEQLCSLEFSLAAALEEHEAMLRADQVRSAESARRLQQVQAEHARAMQQRQEQFDALQAQHRTVQARLEAAERAKVSAEEAVVTEMARAEGMRKALGAEVAALTDRIQALQAQGEAARVEHAELQRRLDDAERAQATTAEAVERATGAAAEVAARQAARLEEAQRAFDAQAAALAERNQALEADVRRLQAERSTFKQSLAAQEQAAEERQKHLEGEARLRAKREEELAAMELRQRMLEEELFKAEAQIELIKDLLLRESGL